MLTFGTGRRPGGALRIGIGGPVGSGKTALVEQLVPRLLRRGIETVVVTNDIVTKEDAEHVRRTLAGILDADRIVGVETGSCPHTAVREDPTMNLAALEALAVQFPHAQVALVESGGDKIPRKRGPGLIRSDLLVINKMDLAPYVGADLGVMARDSEIQRQGRPYLFTNCRTGEGVDAVLERIVARMPVPV